jgi:hypothetical protein
MRKTDRERAGTANKNFWIIPETSTQMSIGGFLKLTGIKDTRGSSALEEDASGTGRNFLVARSVGLNGAKNAPSRDFYLSARESRFIFETVSNVDQNVLSTHIEMDFLGDPTGSAVSSNNYNVRLRRAFAKFKGFSIGQDWSTFSDKPNFGETVDLNGPIGNSQIRQPQIRYSTPKFEDYIFNFAIENPETEFITEKGRLSSSDSSKSDTDNGYIDGIKGENRIPDLVASADYLPNWGKIKLAAVLRGNSIIRQSDGKRFNTFGATVGSSVHFNVFSHDEAFIHLGYGSASGRYFMDSLKAATYYDGDGLHNQRVYHVSVGYKHQWEQKYKLRSTIGWAYLRNLNCNSLANDIRNGKITSSYTDRLNKYVISIHANLMCNVNSNTKAGIEFIVGKRKAESNLSGRLHRFTFCVQMDF